MKSADRDAGDRDAGEKVCVVLFGFRENGKIVQFHYDLVKKKVRGIKFFFEVGRGDKKFV